MSRNRRGRARGSDTSLGGMVDLRNRVEALWEGRHDLSVDDVEANETIREAIDLLDNGEARVAETDGQGGFFGEQGAGHVRVAAVATDDSIDLLRERAGC